MVNIHEFLYDKNSETDLNTIKAGMNRFLERLKQQNALSDYKTVARIPTWEEYYPDPIEREKAQYAVKHIGNELEVTPENTIKVMGYPYIRKVIYRLEFADGSYESVEDYQDISSYEEVVDIKSYHYYTIRNPESQIIIDLAIRPVTPVKMINVKLDITNEI